MEKDIEQKALSASIDTVLMRRILLKERLKNYGIVLLFIFFILFLLFILYYLYMKNLSPTYISVDDIKIEKIYQKKDTQTASKESKKKKQESKKMVPKNGIDYVKHDNFVFKRVWEDGILKKETKLAPTIKESRKIEKIPQFSNEKNDLINDK